jgi:CubicO group peptidase (beta-lactamase class C family)
MNPQTPSDCLDLLESLHLSAETRYLLAAYRNTDTLVPTTLATMTISTARTAQEAVQRRLDDLVESGIELGAQVAAYLGDELVVHAWAGTADPATGQPVDGRTLFPVFSVSKGIVATAVHRLVARHALRYDTRLAELWPEFAACGKEAITVAHVLEHSAGIPYFPTGLTADELADHDRVVSLIAGLEPAWEPGTKTGYHSLTFGYLMAEVARRATGRSVDEVVRTELAEPLGIEDELFIVPPTDQPDRLADIDAAAFGALQAQLPGGTRSSERWAGSWWTRSFRDGSPRRAGAGAWMPSCRSARR